MIMQTNWQGVTDTECVPCYGWHHCIHIHNNDIELFITTDVGPRIIHFGFLGEHNEFAVYPEMLGLTGGDSWRIYGGHRLWHAPEDPVRTYWPDNHPVHFEIHEGFVRFIQPIEENTGLIKEIDIALHPERPLVRVTHRLRTQNLWPIPLAPWALSVMAPGGVAILPLPPRGSHPEMLTPTSTLTLWPYTDMSDPRWTWGERFILLRQEPGNATPQKIGAYTPDGWVAYAHQDHVFIKQFQVIADAAYPDMNSTVELFTNGEMLEVETLGPLRVVAPGDEVTHTELWTLARHIPQPQSETDVIHAILPLIEE